MKKYPLALAIIILGILNPTRSFADSYPLGNYVENNTDGSQTLLGHTPGALASSKFLYHAYSNETLELQIELPLRNQSQLSSLIQDLYDPKSPNYHQWLTPVQFAQQFGYSGNEIDTLDVQESMRAQGLTVAGQSPNGLVVYVNGPVPAVERAFGVHINHYQKSDGTLFFAPDADPTIPVQLAGKINAIGGLDDLPKFRPHLYLQQTQALTSHLGTGPGGFLAPSDVKTAYNLNSVPANDAGQTVALFELDGYKVSDITSYDSYFGINLNTNLLTNVLIDGFSGTPNFKGNGGADEVELDIELVTAFAQGSNILVYEAPNTTQSWIDEWTKIATDNKAKVVSCSWGEPEMDSPTLNFDNTIFQQMASQGQAVFVAAGDSGAFDAGGSTLAVDEPASQPYATAVGISKLTFNSNETYFSESASVYGGGGVSSVWSIPSYQAPMASQAVKAAKVSTTMRNLPDVVLTADAATGYAFYIDGSWAGYYGSSIATPIWASFLSLVNHGLGQPLGFANPWLYPIAQSSNYANDFHDITTGNNGYYPAETGFDDATGLGSFNGYNLYNTLITTTKATTPPSTPTGLTATAGNAQVSLSWNAATGASSYNVQRGSQSGGPYTTIATSVINTTYTDSSVANGSTYYYVVAAVNGAGTSGNSNQASAMPVLPLPATPAGLSASAGNAQVALSWNASTGATSYNISRSTSSTGPFTVSLATGITSTSYTDKSVTNGTTYYYVVSATNTSGTSANSSAVSATPQLPAVPSTPTGLSASAGNAQVALLWNASTGAASYNISRSTSSSGPFTATLATGITSTNYTDTSVTNGTTYYYVVSATNAGGTSANSSAVSATPSLPSVVAVAPPSGLTGLPSYYGRQPAIFLQWLRSTSPNVNRINVYRSTGSAAPVFYGYALGTQLTGVYDTGVVHGNKYNYYVTAVNSSGTESKPSNQISVNY